MTTKDLPIEDRIKLLEDALTVALDKIKDQEKVLKFVVESVIDSVAKNSALCELLVSERIITVEALDHFILMTEEHFDGQILQEEPDYSIGPKGDKILKGG